MSGVVAVEVGRVVGGGAVEAAVGGGGSGQWGGMGQRQTVSSREESGGS